MEKNDWRKEEGNKKKWNPKTGTGLEDSLNKYGSTE